MVASSEGLLACSSSIKHAMIAEDGKLSSRVPLCEEIHQNSVDDDYSVVADEPQDVQPSVRAGKQLRKCRKKRRSQTPIVAESSAMRDVIGGGKLDRHSQFESSFSLAGDSLHSSSVRESQVNLHSKRSSDAISEFKPIGGTVKRHSSHRSTGSESSGKRFRQLASSRAHTPEVTVRCTTNLDGSSRGILSPSVDHSGRRPKSPIAEVDSNLRNNPSPSPSQEQSFSQSAIDTALEAGAALLRLVMPKSKRTSASSREDVGRLASQTVVKDVPPWMQEGPPIRPPPIPPIIEHSDKVSLKSINSSLAGHTYEIVTFNSRVDHPLAVNSCAQEAAIDVEEASTAVIENSNALDAICISHPSSRKTSVRRKRKKSKSRGTLTEEYFSLSPDKLVSAVQNVDRLGGISPDVLTETIYTIPCPSPVGSPCPTPPLRHTSLYRDSSTDSRSSCMSKLIETSNVTSSNADATDDDRNSIAEVTSSFLDIKSKNIEFTDIHSLPSTSYPPQTSSPIASTIYGATVDTVASGSVTPASTSENVRGGGTIGGEREGTPSSDIPGRLSSGSSCELSIDHLNTGSARLWTSPVPSSVGVIGSRSSLPNRSSFLDRIRKSLKLSNPSLAGDSTVQDKSSSVDNLNKQLSETRLSSNRENTKKFSRSHSLVDPVEDFKKFRPSVPTYSNGSLCLQPRDNATCDRLVSISYQYYLNT